MVVEGRDFADLTSQNVNVDTNKSINNKHFLRIGRRGRIIENIEMKCVNKLATSVTRILNCCLQHK